MKDYRSYLLGCCAALLLPAAPAVAQTTNAPADASEAPAGTNRQDRADPNADQAEIVVTGSRLGLTSFNSPTPVNVVGQERAQDLGLVNVADALNQIPAFRPLVGPATNTYRGSQNVAGRSLDLRGLGPTRTLTLIDGRRTVPSSDEGTFDLNSVPSIMVQRSEVVTGGASAAYGADAVAGVVNLILDNRFEGIKGEASYGISQQGDAPSFYAALMAGTRFGGGLGRIVVGAEYTDEGLVEDFDSRDWGRRRYNFIPNPFFNTNPALSNGLPATIATSNVLYSMNPAGVITVAHPLQGMQFDANGNLVPFQFGELYNRARPSTLMVGGDPSVLYAYGANRSPILTPSEHVAVLGHAEYDLTDSLTFLAELSYSNVIGGPTQSAFRNDQNGAIRINRDNAYLTPSTAAAMDAAGVTFLPISRVNIELGDSSVYVSRNHTWRAFAGLKGDIGSRWNWDAFFDYGRTAGRLDSPIQRILSRWRESVDAVRAPAGIPGIAAGTIVCRSTLTNPGNGCIPSNVMGPGKITEQAANWINTAVWQTREFTQTHVGANIRGTLLDNWAGEIAVAAGVEYRRNTSEGEADPFSIAGALQTIVASVLPPTTQKVTEGYAEMAIPLLKDSALGKSLVVDGAIRRTHYSLSGNATTWKVGAVYELNDEYMIRVTRSHDIRAPSASELNPNTRITTQSQADPKYNIAYLIPGVSGGNPNLALERANTFTVGAVFQPNWIPRLRISVDYYDIKVRDAIDVISVSQAINLCRAGTPGVCDIGTDASGNADRILRVYATYQNVNTLRARGLEFVSSYSADVAGGTLNLALNGNYVDTLSTTLPGGTVREFSDVTGNAGQASALFGVPKWRADAVATFARPNWSLTTQFQYIPPALLSRDYIGPHQEGYSVNLPNSINNNRVSSSYYVNLTARVKVINEGDRTVEMFATINNLLDKDPPSNLRYNGNPVYFDGIGRFFRFGVRANW